MVKSSEHLSWREYAFAMLKYMFQINVQIQTYKEIGGLKSSHISI